MWPHHVHCWIAVGSWSHILLTWSFLHQPAEKLKHFMALYPENTFIYSGSSGPVMVGLIWTFLFRISVVILLWVCRFCFCFCLVSFVFGRFLQTQGKTHLKQESFCAGNSRHVRYKYIYWEIHQNKHSGIWTWQRNQTGTNEKSELNPGEGHQCGPVIRTETNQTMALSNCPGPLEWASIFSLDFNKTGFILLVSEERHKLRSPNIIWYSIWYITPVMSNGLHVTWFRLCAHYATFIGCSQRRLYNVITLRVTAKQ